MGKIILQSEAVLPTDYGEFWVGAFAQKASDPMPHLAIASQKMDTSSSVLCRVHSECMTGDVFHSQKCDCGQQLDLSLAEVHKHQGLVIYLRQEGRGIGLIEKLKAYSLQEKGLDTVDANLRLGHQADSREYTEAVDILESLGINEIDLMTNNPDKVSFLENHGIKVNKRIPIVIPAQKNNQEYFETKKKRMGHLF